MVCTTIRPTLLPHPEVATLSSTVAFFANFIAYEPLPDPKLPPEYLASPQSTVKWQVGLVSLAIILAVLTVYSLTFSDIAFVGIAFAL